MIAKAESLDVALETAGGFFDVDRVRRDFPILKRRIYGKPLIYFDNAATSQKPQAVIDEMQRFYTEECANIHRGVHFLSGCATEAYEDARSKVRRFIHATSAKEIVFVRGTTEGINLVAQTYGKEYVEPGDEIVISAMEHHSNIVPWQWLCREKQARLRVAPINDCGELIIEDLAKLLNPRVRLVAITHVSNALGTVNPVERIVELAHQKNIPVLIDGAQAAPHLKVDVQRLSCDFYTFSGHKLYGPNGIGVLYAKGAWLEKMPPYQGGGDMIRSVDFEETTYNSIPYKFEAGTPNISGALGLGAAIDYLERLGAENAFAYERELLSYATAELAVIPGLRIVGTACEKASVVSFTVDGLDCHDLGMALDQEGIAVRTGYHCAQPVMKRFNVEGTVRASLAFYNTREEVRLLGQAIRNIKEALA